MYSSSNAREMQIWKDRCPLDKNITIFIIIFFYKLMLSHELSMNTFLKKKN